MRENTLDSEHWDQNTRDLLKISELIRHFLLFWTQFYFGLTDEFMRFLLFLIISKYKINFFNYKNHFKLGKMLGGQEQLI